MKHLLCLSVLLLASPAVAYTLEPDGQGGVNYGTGPSTIRLDTIENVNLGTQTTIYENGLPTKTCTTYKTSSGYSSTFCQ